MGAPTLESDSNVGFKMMKEKPPYRNWVGVLLGTVLSGSAHFLSGHRVAGVKWYFTLLGTSLLAVIVMAVPGIITYVLAVAI